ncbi:lasso peptide biosynthesis B2 protein [Pseudoxanthomonas koreensis]|uniref:lasso peptide biosynthesis B2 protein n=1 Tax=Pseudoxanthomonas koreensis TaxID=266061 RepID=UPI001391F707|nr:lasso peptide biosynthesis B2 protein [Pseudoxanthomonas koreensis]KAF1695320.1 hypothetical protein CSC64_03470 [Pseudoxanthomonas koreensis]
MGRRLARWREMDWRDRRRLLGCVAGLWPLHASLAVLGYARTRRLVERLSMHPSPQPASEADLADARALARLAASAGLHSLGEAACLRRALLLYGWLRRRGLRPVLQLGVPAHADGPFRAHAWVELEGAPLLTSDAGYLPFARASAQPDQA